MRYSELMIQPMRAELTEMGFRETRTPEEVEQSIKNSDGTVMVVVNSICGCAAGKARPGVAMALSNEKKPDHLITVFAGADIEATEKARSFFTGYQPSSPSIALLKDGKLVYMMERRQIEVSDPQSIAQDLKSAFNQHCNN